MSSSTEARPKLSRRVIKVVILLLGFSVGILFVLAHSEDFAQKMAQIAVERVCADGQLKISIEEFSGSIAGGLHAASVRVVRRSPALDITLNDLWAHLNFDRLLLAGVISLSGQTGHIDVAGLARPGFPFKNLPAFNGLACFANLPTSVEIQNFAVASLRYVPWAELPCSVNVSQFTIWPGSDPGEHQLILNAGADWREKQIASGSISGVLKQRQRRFDGKVDMCFAGQKVVSEICLTQKRKKREVSGYIASASIDIAKLSHWLGPLWQNDFPFGFDGHLDCTGSWLFNSEMGFLGNLTGKCQQVRMVALGLYFALFELNGTWKLFDGNLAFSDAGSSFAGFPAVLAGQIEAVMKPARNWHLNFVCPAVDFAQLSRDLPWGLKYSLNLPELSGVATISLALNGKRPDVSGKASTDGLKIGKNGEERVVSGHASYFQSGLGSSSLTLDFVAVSQRAAPPLFSRFRGPHGSLNGRLPTGNGPYTFHWSLSGRPLHYLNLSGMLLDGSHELLKTEGKWHAGFGHLRANLPGEESTGQYHAEGIPFLDLFLAR